MLIRRIRRRRSMASAGDCSLCSHYTGVPLGRLPQESLLKGLQQFAKAKMPAGEAGNSKDAAKALSHSGDVDTPAVSAQSKLVTVGSGLPSLPKKMVDHIISGQYVDFLIEPSIYTQHFTNAVMSSENWCKVCQSIDHGSDVCPMQSLSSGTTPGPASRKRPLEPSQSAPRKRPAPHSLSQICKRFNQYHGDCRFGDQCIYQHKCDSCGKLGHARSQCPKQKGTSQA